MTGFLRNGVLLMVGGAWVLASLFNGGLPARADTKYWVAGNGNFGADANWSPAIAPTSNDTAVFRRGTGVTYNTTFVGDRIIDPTKIYYTNQLRVGNNTVNFGESFSPITKPAEYHVINTTLDEVGRGIIIGETNNDTSAILNASLADFAGVAATVGDAAGSNGTLNINGGTFRITGISPYLFYPLIVGNAGTGTLNVTNGAAMTVAESAGSSVDIGHQPGSNGTLNVNGPGSTFAGGRGISVGGYGTGTLWVTSGGGVSAEGIGVGSSRTVVVDGAASNLTTDLIHLASDDIAESSLRVQAGGQVFCTGQYTDTIGYGGTGAAHVMVTGPGSLWSVSGDTTIGSFLADYGSGDLKVEDQGYVRLDGPLDILGHGAATVSGVGSLLTADQYGIDVGFGDGTGTLTVQAGGIVTSQLLDIGGSSSENTTGLVTATGTGTTLSVTGTIGVGGHAANLTNGDTGTLSIGLGATVSAGQGVVLFPDGSVQFHGGTLDTSSISFQGGGQFQWTGGTLHVGTFNGGLTNQAGTLAPGHSPGTTTINGNYTQQAGGTLDIQVGGTVSGTDYDVVGVNGGALLGGDLQLSLIDDFLPDAGNTFTVLNALGGVSGSFDNVANGGRLDTLDGLGSFLVHYVAGNNQIVLSDFEFLGLPGDFDHDGDVDGNDFLVWQRGDSPNGINSGDLALWQGQYSNAPPLVSSRAVPEPTTALLLALALVAIFTTSRSVRSQAKE